MIQLLTYQVYRWIDLVNHLPDYLEPSLGRCIYNIVNVLPVASTKVQLLCTEYYFEYLPR